MQALKKQKIVHLYGVLAISGSGMQKMMLCIYVHKHPQTHKHLRACYFEGLRGLNLVNSRGFAFCKCLGACYFEGLSGLNLVNSRGLILHTVFRY